MSGGYLNGLSINAAKQFLSAELGSKSAPHVISSYIRFLSVVTPCVIVLSCHLLRRSSFQTVVRVQIAPGPQPTSATDVTGEKSPAVIAILAFGNMFKEVGLSQETVPSIMTNLPDREKNCLEIDDPYMRLTPMTRKFRWWSPRKDGLWGHHSGGHIRDSFIILADGSSVGLYKITWLADLVRRHNSPLFQAFT